ncbi:helix-turn-helix domain-containing protein [Enemella sp. A6]|uniref:helix-turn-helix domain-containing protein n=1 Tax=Enemella sp. A6 TaxID=3440152 RepID=UPI003EB8560B
MTEFNVIATIRRDSNTLDPDWIDHVHDTFSEFHPAVSAGLVTGRTRVIITLHAENLGQAARLGWALTAELDPIGLQVLETTEFDRTAGLEDLPELISVTEAAERLNITRQAVLERINNGTLPARRAGQRAWVIPAAAVPAP